MLRCLLLDGVGRFRFDLARGLVLGEVKLLFDFALAAAQLLVTLFVLKGSADFGFKFLAPLVGIGNIRFQLASALLETLNGRFQ